ncbi:MAG: DUF3617 family protein [Pseudomonadota bacterium]
MTTVTCRLSSFVPALAVIAMSVPAFADGVPITPGLWEIKTHNSLLGTEEVERQCMRKAVFDPASILGEEEACQVSNEIVSGNTVEYDLACADEEQRGSAAGHFSFTIDGDQGSGNVDLTLDVGGESMSMQYTLAAARVGDC